MNPSKFDDNLFPRAAASGGRQSFHGRIGKPCTQNFVEATPNSQDAQRLASERIVREWHRVYRDLFES